MKLLLLILMKHFFPVIHMLHVAVWLEMFFVLNYEG